jgi:hypothetical protein
MNSISLSQTPTLQLGVFLLGGCGHATTFFGFKSIIEY